MPAIFSARGISKSFGASCALSGVDFDVVEGEVSGLVGANGAGKSTLLKIIIGALTPDAGELRLDGRPIKTMSVRDLAAAGIAMVSQELSLFPSLPIEENLLLAPGAGGWKSRRAFALRAREMLDRLGVQAPLETPLHRLPLADRQLVEIARALLQNPRVLILDEPTSSLHVAEVERLHAIIRTLRDSGIGVVYVSHFLEDLLEISDNLVILRNGRRVPSDIVPAVGALKPVVAAMLGEAPAAESSDRRWPDEQDDADAAIPAVDVGPLRISGLKGPKGLVIDSLTIQPGGITGVAGLAGAGVEELFAILFGRLKPTAGVVTLPAGGPLPAATADAVRAGVAYAPSDRKLFGLMLRQSVAENIVGVRSLTLGKDGFFLSDARLTRIADEQCRHLGVIASSVRRPVGELSGGNQQKVVFAKWIEARPSLLLLDDPTRGIDIAARREMHKLMRRMARAGMVVLFYSSDPGETVAVSDRVFVFVGGEMRRELSGDSLTEQELVAAMNMAAPLATETGAGAA
jgi:ribose transport system ATP-binding protein